MTFPLRRSGEQLPPPFAADFDPQGAPLEVFRRALAEGDRTLRALFDQGASARELVPARARFMDQLLLAAWRRFPPLGQSSALVATGGFGRLELHPGSDVDLLILVEGAPSSTERQAIETFLAFLWDLGLTLGHSVRTPSECASEGARDVTVITNLMEARWLTGQKALFDAMVEAIAPRRIWSSRAFFEAKRQEQQKRHQKYHDTAYNLEPNVKESPGGLRDIQTIGWVAKRHFDVATLHDLVTRGFLTEQEYAELLSGQEFLWQVRLALHWLTNRREDRLLFDYQRALAERFGHRDDDPNAAIEQFMQRYYRTIIELSRLNEMLLQLFEEVILLTDDPGTPVPINRRFHVRRGYLEASSEDVFRRYPFALLEIFLILQQHSQLKGVRATTVRLIRDHRGLIDDRFRADLRARSLFMEILRQPEGVTRQLRRMNRYGVLGAYLPEFGRIQGRMQYDLFHVYTVDTHTLFVVRNLRRFDLEAFADEFPHCSEIMTRIPKPEVLYIAALYHDIAKGRQGDHSELGALDAARFCQRHGLNQRDEALVVWLVRHHLLMSLTAQKRDIHDPAVVDEFAHQVGTQEHLNHLYLLTVADIRATNPSLWNDWRRHLLENLYEVTHQALVRGLDHPVDRAERIGDIQREARRQLIQTGIAAARIQRLWADFSDDYFLRHSGEEVAWHTRAVLKKADDNRALVLARPDNVRGGTEIFIHTRNRPNIFALTTAVVERLNLNVVDARLSAAPKGYTLDSYTVLEQSGSPIADRTRLKEILLGLRSALNRGDRSLPPPPRHLTPRRLKHFHIPTRVTFIDDHQSARTIVEIVSLDRPGLLSCIARAFIDEGVVVVNAKIATIGARAEDVFFITDGRGQPLCRGEQFSALRRTLIQRIEEAAGP